MGTAPCVSAVRTTRARCKYSYPREADRSEGSFIPSGTKDPPYLGHAHAQMLNNFCRKELANLDTTREANQWWREGERTGGAEEVLGTAGTVIQGVGPGVGGGRPCFALGPGLPTFGTGLGSSRAGGSSLSPCAIPFRINSCPDATPREYADPTPKTPLLPDTFQHLAFAHVQDM